MNCYPPGMNIPNIVDNNKCYSNVANSPCYTRSCSNDGTDLNCSGGCGGSCGGNSTQGLNDMSQYTGIFNNGCGCCGNNMTAVSTGLNAYQVAVLNGYTGTLDDWLASLQGQTTSGTFTVSVLGGNVALPILSSTTYYTKSGNVVNWTATITLANAGSATGNITITGFPSASNMAQGNFAISIDVLSGASTYVSFIMANGIATGYKDNVANVVASGNPLTNLEVSDLTFPAVLSLSGNYIVTGS